MPISFLLYPQVKCTTNIIKNLKEYRKLTEPLSPAYNKDKINESAVSRNEIRRIRGETFQKVIEGGCEYEKYKGKITDAGSGGAVGHPFSERRTGTDDGVGGLQDDFQGGY